MAEEWRFVDSGPSGAAYNMALDEAIANSVRSCHMPPTLRFYGWEKPSVSLGCFQRTSDINLAYCSKHNIPVVRRPTGGRAILHNHELTYSFSARTDQGPFASGLLDSYGRLSRAFEHAFSHLGIVTASKRVREKGEVLSRNALCFQSSSFGEILVKNRKIVGSAQKRWPDGLLQQGSIPFRYDYHAMQEIFGQDKHSEATGCMTCMEEVMDDFCEDDFREAVVKGFEEIFRISLKGGPLLPEEIQAARMLEAEKYSSRQWNVREGKQKGRQSVQAEKV